MLILSCISEILMHKNIFFRCSMDLPLSYFKTKAMLRRLHENWQSDPGCLYQPIFMISPENIVVAELHCMLRVADKLEKGLINICSSIHG